MNTTLEDRLRRHYDELTRDLPAHGPGLDAPMSLDVPLHSTRRRAPQIALLVGTAAAAAALGFAMVNRSTDDGPQPAGPAATPDAVPTSEAPAAFEPAATLPDSPDLSESPVTVAGSSPTSWYRLQPDLDIAWYGSPTTTFCWRTPVDQQCVDDPSGGGLLPLVVPSAGGQTLVVTGAPGASLDVQLSDGQVLSAPLDQDEQISWQVARFELPAGTTIVSTGTASSITGDDASITGATLPPAVDLVDVPLTVPAGSELTYWRWFADLDISERQRAAGGTELCWRTPAGIGCVDDSFTGPEVGIIPTDGAVILLARPALVEIVPPPTDPLEPKFEMGPAPTTVTATLSDGSSVLADVEYGQQFGVGFARIDLPPGVTVTHAESS
ncbi:MAG: hypothetical protein HZB15_07655 [Actinobacteria bacterium]|nr:hypothetical protein [Actinomycetota bacterium]